MKLLAVRHGQAEHNRAYRLNDDPASKSDLTESGRSQAETAATALKNEPIKRIYTSQLPRAVQTADIINRYHSVKQSTDSRLNEVKTGFHGRSVWAWVSRRLLHRDNLDKRYGSGESLAEAKDRVEDFLNEVRTAGDDTVLVVAHQHTLQALMALVEGHDYRSALRRPIKNAQILEFEL